MNRLGHLAFLRHTLNCKHGNLKMAPPNPKHHYSIQLSTKCLYCGYPYNTIIIFLAQHLRLNFSTGVGLMVHEYGIVLNHNIRQGDLTSCTVLR